MSEGVRRIANERTRQISAKGYDTAHDDEHDNNEIAWAAVCYAAPAMVYVRDNFYNTIRFQDPWPWGPQCDKRPRDEHGDVAPERGYVEDRIRLLEKAGALIAAEIDRLLRIEEVRR